MMSTTQPWTKEIQDHILGECLKCQAIIADHPSYGRKPNSNDHTLCECCETSIKTQVEINTIKNDLRDRREALRDQRAQLANNIDSISSKLRTIIQHEHGEHKDELDTMCPACE